MTDNLEKILPLLKFETKDDFYYLHRHNVRNNNQ